MPSHKDENELSVAKPLNPDGKEMEDETQGVRLERRLGLPSGVALIVGTMIGSGIFVSPKGVLQRSGSIGLTLLVWAGGGIISLFGALSFAELGTLISKSGGDYIYIHEAFKDCGVFGPIPAFLYAWTFGFLLKPASIAITSLAFAKYMVTPFFLDCEPPVLPIKLLAICNICMITLINCMSVNFATRVTNLFTVAKLSALVFIIGVGFYYIITGETTYLEDPFSDSSWELADIATAGYSAMWAYDGWNNLNFVTEELINPYVNLPRSILIAIPLVTVVYVFTNLSYLTVLSKMEFLASEAVAVRFGNYILGPATALVTLAVAASTFGSANGCTFGAARISFTAAREGHQLEFFSFAQMTRLTPAPALMLNGGMAILMVVAADIGSLIDFFGFAAWLFYGLATFTVIVFRFTKKDHPRPYKVPIILPIIVVLCAIYLVFAPIVQNPQVEYVYACIFILAGLFFYFPFVHCGYNLKITGIFTRVMQKVFLVVPTLKAEDPSLEKQY